MKIVKGKKKLLSKIIYSSLKFFSIPFIFCMIFSSICQGGQIAEKKKKLENINNSVVMQNFKNDKLKEMVHEQNDEKIARVIEHIAKEKLGFSRPEEKIFVNITGN